PSCASATSTRRAALSASSRTARRSRRAVTSLTSSLLDVRTGSQVPRVANFPPYPTTAAPEAIDLAAAAGLHLDEWQRYVLTHGMGQTAGGDWTAKRVSVWVPRQNGKGAIIRSEEHTSELQSRENLVCRLLLEKKKRKRER